MDHVPHTLGHRHLALGASVGVALAAVIAGAPGAALASNTGVAPAQHHAARYRSVVAHLDGHTYTMKVTTPAGIKPIHPGAPAAAGTAASGNTLAVGSSASTEVVTPHPAVFLVFWGSQWSNDPAGAEPALQTFFKGLFGSDDTWGQILDQYCEGVPAGTTNCAGQGIPIVHPSSSPLAGVFMDNSSPAPTNATASQISAEAVRAAQHFGSSATTDQNAQYVIASASGTHPDGFPSSGFCAYHNNVSASGVGQVAYTNLPYIPDLGAGGCTTLSNPSLLDGYFSTETHEYAETVTDPVPPNGWVASSGSEIGDECVQLDGTETLTTGTFDVQGLWSNSANACVTSGGGGGGGGYPSGFHQLVGNQSGLCVDVSGASTANNAQVVQWTCKTSGQSNQEWQFNPVSNGFGELQSQGSGKDLVVQGASKSNGAKVIQYTQNGTTNGLWKPIQLSNGSWQFQNDNSGQCLDVTGASTSTGVQLDQWPCKSSAAGGNQAFATR